MDNKFLSDQVDALHLIRNQLHKNIDTLSNEIKRLHELLNQNHTEKDTVISLKNSIIKNQENLIDKFRDLLYDYKRNL